VTDATLTIDELARKAGMTVRNVRSHQSRGLLPPPEVRGRVGHYGPDHLERLELIKELQGQGFNLEGIRQLIEGASGSTSDLLGFTRAIREPFQEEEPEVVDVQALNERWGDDPALLEKAVEQGLLTPLGNGLYETPTPRLMRAGDELARLGVDAKTALEVLSKLRRHADAVAKIYVDIFVKQVWKPFNEAGRPEDRWPEMQEAVERLRPLAAEALLAVFGPVMTDRVESTFGRELERSLKKTA
jgi:DNA-binding transcriptional MerR regulator